MYHANKNRQVSVSARLMRSYLKSWLNEGKLPHWANDSCYESVIAKNAFVSTKNFHDQIRRSDASVDTIVESLQEMRRNTKHFEILYGITWPLLSF